MKEYSAISFLTDVLGIDVSGMVWAQLEAPVIEGEDEREIYIKFMSHKGLWDDELGDRFADVVSAQGGEFVRRRKRSGTVDLAYLPKLREWWRSAEA